MAGSPVLHALERKYAHLLGCKSRLKHPPPSLAQDLDHIAAVIRLFYPDWRREDVRPIVPASPKIWGSKGRGIRTALLIMRERQEPMTTLEIVLAVLERLNTPRPDKYRLKVMVSSFHTNLLHQLPKGMVMCEGKPKRWMIAIACAS